MLLGEHFLEYFMLPNVSSRSHPGRDLSPSSEKSILKKLDNPTIFDAWAEIGPQFYLIGDEYGKLYGLTLEVVDDHVCDFSIEALGETPKASVMVYLGDGYLFIGSHSGDSQLVKLRAVEPKIELVQTLPNIAPVLDFTVMDMGNQAGEGQPNEYSSGQARIISCSGAYHDGSLRSVRSGVGLHELGIVAEITGIRDVYGLRSSAASRFDDILVVSFVDETRVFRFDAQGDVDEMDSYHGFSLSESTLVAANVLGDHTVQVTGTGAWLIDSESGTTIAEWKPALGQKITAASTNDEQVVLSIGGESITILDIRTEFASIKTKSFGNDSQIACVTVPPLLNICIIGFWRNSTVSVFNLDSLDIAFTEELSSGNEASVPRSLLVTRLLAGQPPTLFVAMADGVVHNFSISPEDFSLSSKKSIVLGRQQANLRNLPREDGLFNVFATCDHPSLIYGSEGRVVYSAVTAEQATCVCPFDAEAFPGSIVVATSEDLKIALVDTERTTHVRTLHMRETVRRVAYSKKLKVLGLGTIHRAVESGTETMMSYFKLVDEVQFKLLDKWDLNEDEMVECITRADLAVASFDNSPSTAEHFVVGTSYLDDQNDKSGRGRIIVFEVTTDQKLKNLVEITAKGACRCLSTFDGKIVAALTNVVRSILFG
jgi:DNA damage-binding protein 1